MASAPPELANIIIIFIALAPFPLWRPRRYSLAFEPVLSHYKGLKVDSRTLFALQRQQQQHRRQLLLWSSSSLLSPAAGHPFLTSNFELPTDQFSPSQAKPNKRVTREIIIVLTVIIMAREFRNRRRAVRRRRRRLAAENCSKCSSFSGKWSQIKPDPSGHCLRKASAPTILLALTGANIALGLLTSLRPSDVSSERRRLIWCLIERPK